MRKFRAAFSRRSEDDLIGKSGSDNVKKTAIDMKDEDPWTKNIYIYI